MKVISIILAVALIGCIVFSVFQMNTISGLKDKSEQLISEKEELDKLLAQAKQEAGELTAQNNEYQAEIETLNAANNAFTKANEEIGTSMDTAITSMQSVQEKLKSIETIMGIAADETSEEVPEEVELNDSLQKAEHVSSLLALLVKRTEALQPEIETSANTIQELRGTVDEQKQMIAKVTEDLNNSKLLYDEAVQSGTQKDETIAGLNTTISELEAQLTMLRTTVDEWLTPASETDNE